MISQMNFMFYTGLIDGFFLGIVVMTIVACVIILNIEVRIEKDRDESESGTT